MNVEMEEPFKKREPHSNIKINEMAHLMLCKMVNIELMADVQDKDFKWYSSFVLQLVIQSINRNDKNTLDLLQLSPFHQSLCGARNIMKPFGLWHISW